MKLPRVLGLLAVAAVCAVVMAGAVPSAEAMSTFTTPCHGCHGRSGAAPSVTLVSDNGTTATYHVDATALWEVFDSQAPGAPDNTKIASGSAPGGTFSGPSGHTFTVEQENGTGFGVTAIGASVYTVTPSSGANGQISPSGAQILAGGDEITFTIKSDAGYKVADVLVDSASVGAVTTYKFSNVVASHTISASFTPDVTYTLTYVAGPNGTISGPLSQKVTPGGSGTAVTAVPNSGYHFVSWSDGLTTASRTDTNVGADRSFTATFASNQVATTMILKVSTTSVVHGRYVTLTATLKGGAPAGTKVAFKVKTPGKSSYASIASVGISAKGVAVKKYRVAKKGTYYFQAVFAGNAGFKACKSTATKVRSK
jgi:hypothetical protein